MRAAKLSLSNVIGAAAAIFFTLTAFPVHSQQRPAAVVYASPT